MSGAGGFPAKRSAAADKVQDVRAYLASKLHCWHRLTGEESDQLVALFEGLAMQHLSLDEQLAAAMGSLVLYKSRVQKLEQWQSKMRDPERTIVCDIIANGHTLGPAGDRYTPPAPLPAQEPVGHFTGKFWNDDAHNRMVCEVVCDAIPTAGASIYTTAPAPQIAQDPSQFGSPEMQALILAQALEKSVQEPVARIVETGVGADVFVFGVKVPDFAIGTAANLQRQAFVDAVNTAAAAKPVQEPSDHPDFPGTSKVERQLRRMLCLSRGNQPYMDDGEASDGSMHPFIDYMRDTPDEIAAKWEERNRKTLSAHLAAALSLRLDELEAAHGIGTKHLPADDTAMGKAMP